MIARPRLLSFVIALLLSVCWSLALARDASVDEATLTVFNRSIITFRSEFLGAKPAFRASRARMVIEEALNDGADLEIQVKPSPEGQLVMLGHRLAFVITSSDADPLLHENSESVAQRAAGNLQRAVEETRELRNPERMLKSAGKAVLASAVVLLLLWLIHRIRSKATTYLLRLASRKAASLRVGNTPLLDTHTLLSGLSQSLRILALGLAALLLYQWLSFVLSSFPYTRSWGERLNGYLLGIASEIMESIVGAIPDLGIAIAIFLLARLCISFAGQILHRLTLAQPDHPWLRTETVPTSRRLISIAIWLFALAMAYPYLPGAQTEAFKGLSVLLGLMLSLGASSIIGQGTAGLVLTYTGTLRVGEYVRIGEHEGTVVDMGLFTTRIRTGLGEELTLPNSMITSSVTKNYSRAVHGPGYIVDTVVTIGYDTPWRQVEAMLIEAARRTPGILVEPPPRVFQTALSDYYPEYRLVAQAVPTEPRPRAEVLSTLHANIQDVFNTHGVQIMSPHYMADPEDAKLVLTKDWYRTPAEPPEKS
ncbi:mechanosensitive ion channel family protein [Azonexus sp. IMCC34839]|uniref:mechanosensitive ion channel family protein n=1 Tax=Azonexus sp. IMCC34839 TaxID=3133695 RepID=UPI003999C4E6